MNLKKKSINLIAALNEISYRDALFKYFYILTIQIVQWNVLTNYSRDMCLYPGSMIGFILKHFDMKAFIFIHV